MACEKCLKYQGDSTTHYSVFEKVFEVIESYSTSATEGGTAMCRFCNQQIKFGYDETLIPKLRIEFTD